MYAIAGSPLCETGISLKGATTISVVFLVYLVLDFYSVSPRSIGSGGRGDIEEIEEGGKGKRRASQDKEAQKAKNIVEQLEMGEEWGVGIYQLQKPLVQRQSLQFSY